VAFGGANATLQTRQLVLVPVRSHQPWRSRWTRRWTLRRRRRDRGVLGVVSTDGSLCRETDVECVGINYSTRRTFATCTRDATDRFTYLLTFLVTPNDSDCTIVRKLGCILFTYAVYVASTVVISCVHLKCSAPLSMRVFYKLVKVAVLFDAPRTSHTVFVASCAERRWNKGLISASFFAYTKSSLKWLRNASIYTNERYKITRKLQMLIPSSTDSSTPVSLPVLLAVSQVDCHCKRFSWTHSRSYVCLIIICLKYQSWFNWVLRYG